MTKIHKASRFAEVRDTTVFVLLMMFSSSALLHKNFGFVGLLVYGVFVAGIYLIARKVFPLVAPLIRRRYVAWVVVVVLGLSAVLLILHPIEDRGGLGGRSSDRDEGLNIAITRLIRGESPYYPPNDQAGPLSILPGAIFLAVPFVLLGDSTYQNLPWLMAFLALCTWAHRDKAAAWVGFVLIAGLCPTLQYEFISGGDMLANGIYIPLSTLLVHQLWRTEGVPPIWLKWAAVLLMGIAFASRPNFLFILPLFSAWMIKSSNFWRAAVTVGGVFLVTALVTLPFYFIDPNGFTPLIAGNKLEGISRTYPQAGSLVVVSTIILSLVGFVAILRCQKLTLGRAFFKWACVVTLWPMAIVVILSSMVRGELDFSFMQDRYGLMYLFFGWLGFAPRLNDKREDARRLDPVS